MVVKEQFSYSKKYIFYHRLCSMINGKSSYIKYMIACAAVVLESSQEFEKFQLLSVI